MRFSENHSEKLSMATVQSFKRFEFLRCKLARCSISALYIHFLMESSLSFNKVVDFQVVN